MSLQGLRLCRVHAHAVSLWVARGDKGTDVSSRALETSVGALHHMLQGISLSAVTGLLQAGLYLIGSHASSQAFSMACMLAQMSVMQM